MFDAVPLWLKSLIGCGVMVFILVQGVRLTSKKGNGGSNNNSNNNSNS